MGRGLAILTLLVPLVVGGWLLTAQMSASPGGQAPAQHIEAAGQAASALTFRQAEVQLEQFRALNGTYAGASLAGFDVTLVRADASSYCLQAGSATTTSHLAGPDGTSTAGPC
jgi:hypothetical protein